MAERYLLDTSAIFSFTDQEEGAAEVERILELASQAYAGCNDSHLADLLAEREGITIASSSLQRLLREAQQRKAQLERQSAQLESAFDRMNSRGSDTTSSGRCNADMIDRRSPPRHNM